MKFNVHEQISATADKRRILKWLSDRSPRGAGAWLRAYDRMLDRLEDGADSFAAAFENAELEMDVKEALFKTSRGRVYRALFVIENRDVFILRIRGPGQAPVDWSDIGF